MAVEGSLSTAVVSRLQPLHSTGMIPVWEDMHMANYVLVIIFHSYT